MNQEKVKIGVIGIGHLGSKHVEQLLKVSDAEIVGIYDIDIQRCQLIAKKYELEYFPSYGKLLEESGAVSIVTPTKYHHEHALQALAADKHVFVEKPITQNLEQADELISMSRKKKKIIQVGHIERFNPAIIALDKIKIDPLFIESHRLASFDVRGTDVAVVMDLMVHDIDLILSFVKSPVQDVDASGVSIVSTNEDIANCRLKFENGCIANVTASRISAKKMRKMRFFQPNAYISIDFLEGITEMYYVQKKGQEIPETGLAFSLGKIEMGDEKKDIHYARLAKKDINPLNYELQLFCQSIINDTEPAVTAEDGRRAIKIANMIMNSIQQHTEHVRKFWRI
jgi:predicted dehydrogenase